jgi:hypothetical protein
MSTFAQHADISEDIRVVACASLNDDKMDVTRNIVIFEYNCLGKTYKRAYYQSSATSVTTNKIFEGTYFPFYGSMNGTLKKALQYTHPGSIAPVLQPWQTDLTHRYRFIKVTDEIFKRFTHFYELKISALIGSHWWNAGGTSSMIRDFVMSHVWDEDTDQFIHVGLHADHFVEHLITQCFSSNELNLSDTDEAVNDFLSHHDVTNDRARATRPIASASASASASATPHSPTRHRRTKTFRSSRGSIGKLTRSIAMTPEVKKYIEETMRKSNTTDDHKGGANIRSKRKKYKKRMNAKNKTKRRTRRHRRSH